jgi:uncharacterized membrane protein
MAPPRRTGIASSRAGRLAVGAVVTIAVATVIGLVVLWPGDAGETIAGGLAAPTEEGEVIAVRTFECTEAQAVPGQPSGGAECGMADVRVESGPDAGSEVQIQLGGGALAPELSVGDRVRLSVTEAPPGAPAGPGATPGAAGERVYSLADFERKAPMLWLALAFVVLVIVFGRLRGALSLVGLGLSLAIVLVFIVPAILDDRSPPAVALVGSLAVMLTTILLAHGWNPKSIAAILGTTVSLLLVVGLALAFADLAHLTGFSSEEAVIIGSSSSDLSFDGLLVAGMVVGALGVLDDVTVSQASTVMAVRAANPGENVGRVYRRAIEVGRDHVSATVNTLVLAYVGASLPILLLFSSGELGVLDAANTELVATEIVATLVGSIGLIAAVPVTTVLAAVLAGGLSAREIEAEAGSAHSH